MLFFKDMHSNCQVLINFPNALVSSDWKVDIVKHILKMVKGNEKTSPIYPKPFNISRENYSRTSRLPDAKSCTNLYKEQ